MPPRSPCHRANATAKIATPPRHPAVVCLVAAQPARRKAQIPARPADVVDVSLPAASAVAGAASVRVSRAPLAIAAATVLTSVGLFALSDRELPVVLAFVPAFLAVVWLLDLLSAFLLFTQYLSGASARLLVLGCAYLWSSSVMIAQAMAAPGLITAEGLLGAAPSSVAWLWTAWHVGFPFLIGLAIAPWRFSSGALSRHRGVTTAVAGVLVTATVAAVTWLVTAGHAHLPVIVEGQDFSVLTHRFGMWILGVDLIAILVAATCFRRGAVRGLEGWAFVAVVATACDVVLTLYSPFRATIGWYGARVMSLVAAMVVLTALLREITTLYRRVRADAEELAGHNRELRAANALRDHLVAVVSHELRTPLTALMGIVEMLRSERESLSTEDVNDLVGRSDALTRRLSMLTEDLLTASTMDSGELHMTPAPVDLAAALGECARTFPMIETRVSCPDGLVVDADPLRLQQILANFLRNSVKYGAAPVDLIADARAGTARIRVRDHGAGVPPEFVPRMFEPFTRSEQAKAGALAGSGLGLSIVATLAAGQGGEVSYEPAEPGACFVLTLPRHELRVPAVAVWEPENFASPNGAKHS
jgi:signal transduction histidine kinase